MNPIDPSRIENLVAALSDSDHALSPAEFLGSSEAGAHSGLYSWWGNATAREVIEESLGSVVSPLIYAGQAGATRWPSGTRSSATLGSRIRGNHISGNASSSTFRLTVSALLLHPLGLTVLKPGRLVPEDRARVSVWIRQNLRVAILSFQDRDELKLVEDAVLDVLDPPLNLEGRPSTEPRRKLSELRRLITHPDGPG